MVLLRELSHECETDPVPPTVLAALMVQRNAYFDQQQGERLAKFLASAKALD